MTLLNDVNDTIYLIPIYARPPDCKSDLRKKKKRIM